MTTKTKTLIDWELIERHYRAGLLSLREICAEHEVATLITMTEGAIRKRAKKDGWERNLKAKIAARTEELVRKEAVRTASTQLTPADEKTVVEANAKLGVTVRLNQREDAQRMRSLTRKLLDELEITTDNKELFAQLGELLDESGPDSSGRWKVDKQNEIYRKVISMSGRVTNVKAISDILEKLQKLEVDSYGLENQQESSPLDEVLKKLAKERNGQ